MTQVVQRDDAEVDDPHVDLTDAMADPMRAIVEEETRRHGAELETMRRALGMESAEEDTDSPETSQQPDKTTSPQGETGAGEGKRPGIDQVLNDIETNLGGNHADVVRSVLSRYHDNQREWKEAQIELRETLLELRKMQESMGSNGQAQPNREGAGQQQTPEVDPMLKNITPQQWRLFDKMAEQRGFVRQEHLEAERRAESQEDYVQEDIDRGLEEFGETFGRRTDDGKFMFPEEVQADVQKVYDRVFDETRGVTARDLYILARYNQLHPGNGRERPDAEPKAAPTQDRADRLAQARRAQTEQSSTAAPTQSKIYTQGKDSLDAVIARAAALAWREVP